MVCHHTFANLPLFYFRCVCDLGKSPKLCKVYGGVALKHAYLNVRGSYSFGSSSSMTYIRVVTSRKSCQKEPKPKSVIILFTSPICSR